MRKRLKELLAAPPTASWRGGIPCSTCVHPKAKDIAADFAEFKRRKSEGHAMPWSAFYRYLREEYHVTTCDSAFARHRANCTP